MLMTMMTSVNQIIMTHVGYVMVMAKQPGLQIEMGMDWEIQRLLLKVAMSLWHPNNNNKRVKPFGSSPFKIRR